MDVLDVLIVEDQKRREWVFDMAVVVGGRWRSIAALSGSSSGSLDRFFIHHRLDTIPVPEGAYPGPPWAGWPNTL